jgi:hypothetical protein
MITIINLLWLWLLLLGLGIGLMAAGMWAVVYNWIGDDRWETVGHFTVLGGFILFVGSSVLLSLILLRAFFLWFLA